MIQKLINNNKHTGNGPIYGLPIGEFYGSMGFIHRQTQLGGGGYTAIYLTIGCYSLTWTLPTCICTLLTVKRCQTWILNN